MPNFIRQAFDTACKDARKPEEWYVALYESVPYYGGPEEGGWWGRDTVLLSWKAFTTEKAALSAVENVHKLADELKTESRKAFGEQCLREMEWLDARGLDADFLPEPDGESDYSVSVGEGTPEQGRLGCRQYS